MKMKKMTKACKCNKPYELKGSGYTLCLKCGKQYPTVGEEEKECYECGREWTRNNGRGCPYNDPNCFLCDKHDHNNCDEVGEEE
tara:strand:- start:164 stop:415 length:252 start_codon:yes stop_codon:yes gene_type:complete